MKPPIVFRAVCVVAVTVARLAAQPGPAASTPLIEADGLHGWFADGPACVRNDAGTILMTSCAGWVRTEQTVFGDYAVTFEVRSRDAASQGFLGVLGVDGARRQTEVVVAAPVVGAYRPRKGMKMPRPVRQGKPE